MWPPQAAAELLEEQRRALGRAQHEHGVDRGHVDTFVEQVDGEHGPYSTLRQIRQRGLPFGPWAAAPHAHGIDAVSHQVARHEASSPSKPDVNGSSVGHQPAEPLTVTRQNCWPPTGRTRWPLTAGLLIGHPTQP